MSEGMSSPKRIPVESAVGDPSNQTSDSDNLPTNMNTPSLKLRGFRADQLIDMAADEGYRLGVETPRTDKMKG